jgi:hypothetical protein
MRTIDHLAIERQGAGVGVVGEQAQDGLGAGDLLGGWREYLVDDRHLVGMDGELAGETVARRHPRLLAQSLRIAEVDEHGVDRLHGGGDRRVERHVARQAIGRRPAALIAVRA